MKKQVFVFLMALTAINITAQELSVDHSSSVNIEKLPEYVVVTSENTKLLGGMNINIDSKKSGYENVLKDLEELLQKNKNRF